MLEAAFYHLESQFKRVEAQIGSLRQSTSDNDLVGQEKELIERCFDYETRVDSINQWRSKLLGQLDTNMKEALSYLSKINSRLSYYTSDPNRINLKDKKQFRVSSQAIDLKRCSRCSNYVRCVKKNELSVFKKLKFYDCISNTTKVVHWIDRHTSFVYLTDDVFLAHFKSQFCLVDKNFELFKLVKVHKRYNIQYINTTIEKKLIVVLSQEKAKHFKHVFIFDFDLNLLHHKKLSASGMKFSTRNFFYQYAPVFNNQVDENHDWIIKVMSYDLKQLDELNIEMYKGTIKVLLFVLDDKIVFKHQIDQDESTIRVAHKDQINTSIKISVLDSPLDLDQYYFVKCDAQNYLYFFNISRFDEDKKLVFCYDLSGKLLFKRVLPLLDQGYNVEFTFDELVLFDKSYDSMLIIL